MGLHSAVRAVLFGQLYLYGSSAQLFGTLFRKLFAHFIAIFCAHFLSKLT
jgi:hypothetical protein